MRNRTEAEIDAARREAARIILRDRRSGYLLVKWAELIATRSADPYRDSRGKRWRRAAGVSDRLDDA